jgi:hypothetical protein
MTEFDSASILETEESEPVTTPRRTRSEEGASTENEQRAAFWRHSREEQA